MDNIDIPDNEHMQNALHRLRSILGFKDSSSCDALFLVLIAGTRIKRLESMINGEFNIEEASDRLISNTKKVKKSS